MNRSAAVMEAMVNKAFRKKGWNKYTCFYYHGGTFYIGRYDVETDRLKSYEIESRHIPEGEYHPINFRAWQKAHEEYLLEKKLEEYLASKMREDKKKEYELPKEVQKELDLYCEEHNKSSEEEKADDFSRSMSDGIKDLREKVDHLRKNLGYYGKVSANQHDNEYRLLSVVEQMEERFQALEDSVRKMSNTQMRHSNEMDNWAANMSFKFENVESRLLRFIELAGRKDRNIRKVAKQMSLDKN